MRVCNQDTLPAFTWVFLDLLEEVKSWAKARAMSRSLGNKGGEYRPFQTKRPEIILQWEGEKKAHLRTEMSIWINELKTVHLGLEPQKQS